MKKEISAPCARFNVDLAMNLSVHVNEHQWRFNRCSCLEWEAVSPPHPVNIVVGKGVGGVRGGEGVGKG